MKPAAMNNTMSQHGLSYSHPGYASHPNASYCYPTASTTQALVYNHSNAGTAAGQHVNAAIHGSTHQHGSLASIPAHLKDPNLNLPILSSDARPAAMYPQSSFYINPYMNTMTMPLSLGQQASFMSHHYIAPPPGFNVTSSGGVMPPYCPDVAPVSTSAADSSRHQIYSSNPSSVVPYNAAFPPPPPAPYHTPFVAYKYPQEYPGVCADVDVALYTELHETHLSHLNTDDSPDKLQLRKTMDELIERFLSMTPHRFKFSFAGVRETLEKSILELPSCDAFKAAEAFEALASYATNLVSQPWRREYRAIKVYSGYWVHHVSEHLVGAEAILLLMGYQPSRRSRAGKTQDGAPVGCYELPASPSMVDGDLVTRLALDCHIACSECQVLGQLHQHLPGLTLRQLLQYRQQNVGTYQQMVQKLLPLCPKSSNVSSPWSDEVDTAPSKSPVFGHTSPTKLTSPTKAPAKTLAASQSQLQLSAAARNEGRTLPLSSLPSTPTSSMATLDRPRLGDITNATKTEHLQLTSQPHHSEGGGQMRELDDLFENLGMKEARLSRPARPERHRETLGRRHDDKRGVSSVAIAKLIDHSDQNNRQDNRLDNRLENRHDNKHENRHESRSSRKSHEAPTSILPKVLPHARSTKPYTARGSGGVMAPLDTGEGCCLPASIPREVFQESTLDEHVSKAFSHAHDLGRSDARGTAGPKVPSLNSDWDFVLKNLENRGYSKDVGNRGDILQRELRSPESTPHPDNKEGMVDLIPSTVHAVNKDMVPQYDVSNSVNGALNVDVAGDASLRLGERRAGAGAGSCSARDRASERSRGGGGDSSSVTDQRQSLYDNVSYDGFQTARQDSDEEEDVRKLAADRLHDAGYHKTLLPGDKYAPQGGDKSCSRDEFFSKLASPQPTYVADKYSAHGGDKYPGKTADTFSPEGSNHSDNQSSSNSSTVPNRTSSKSSKFSKQKFSNLGAVLTSKLSGSDSGKNKSSEGKPKSTSETVVPWSCVACTFQNETSSNICEMCSKSRPHVSGPIKPLETGGRECQQCTLINEKTAIICSACNLPLESCPTYI
ncbi:uncharacterized protein LOC108670104 isoform X2 [Hyalella azteca]|uniref:Uncharacterized protein LOC108670104 isoform X2 n=1 Tax=Hyalella azteca TaxID=294128 RepID=A0A979FUD9_HYAAZ|nr:uncharacterized protein LOC108670104 isoform X2 [Hyalella azteca]